MNKSRKRKANEKKENKKKHDKIIHILREKETRNHFSLTVDREICFIKNNKNQSQDTNLCLNAFLFFFVWKNRN